MYRLIFNNWSPFGDKTPVGWTITVAYFVATVLTYRAYRRERQRENRGELGVRSRFWHQLTWAMLLLGINKQLDLQRLVTRFGRALSFAMQIWGHRRPMQAVFIGCVALVGLVIVITTALKMRGLRLRYFVALFGIGFLVVFVVIRAASFHYVDRMLGLRFHNVYVNNFLELGGIIWISLGAIGALIGKDSSRWNA